MSLVEPKHIIEKRLDDIKWVENSSFEKLQRLELVTKNELRRTFDMIKCNLFLFNALKHYHLRHSHEAVKSLHLLIHYTIKRISPCFSTQKFGGKTLQSAISVIHSYMKAVNDQRNMTRVENICASQKEDKESIQQYTNYLEIYLQRYPFSLSHWEQYLKCQKDLATAYATALLKLPRSPQMWRIYLSNFDSNTQPQKYRKELEKALLEIGTDIWSLDLFQKYCELIKDNFTKFEFFKRLFAKPLVNLEESMLTFNAWVEGMTDSELYYLYAKETSGQGNETTPQQYIQYFKNQISRPYSKAVEYRNKKLQIQSKIKHPYFDQSEQRVEEYPIWREYIALQRRYGISEHIIYCYQRALMSHPERVQLWEQAFFYLQNEAGKCVRVLAMLRNNSHFFLYFSNPKLYYYWCDLEERENADNARKMYTSLIAVRPHHLETFLRQVQFQIRVQAWTNAKNLYDQMLITYQTNLETLCFVLVEYAHFVIKCFRDLQYPKKLLKSYFDGLPFNEYLFTCYLEFLRQFQTKEGYSEQVMTTIVDGLQKAKKSLLDSEFRRIVSLAKHHIRTVFGSIYLIKQSERRIVELEDRL